jgi:hypothetical protein
MKIVIDIPEDMYNDIQKHLTDDDQCYALSDYKLREVIRNGKSYEDRPQGEWIDCGEYYRCPFCSNWVLTVDGKPNYCDECGADMRGKENEKMHRTPMD